MKSKETVRISLMVRKDQYEKMEDMGVNISGYIRDLIDDNLNEYLVTLAVDEETKQIYDQIISQAGEGDRELTPYFKKALKELLAEKIKQMQKLHDGM